MGQRQTPRLSKLYHDVAAVSLPGQRGTPTPGEPSPQRSPARYRWAAPRAETDRRTSHRETDGGGSQPRTGTQTLPEPDATDPLRPETHDQNVHYPAYHYNNPSLKREPIDGDLISTLLGDWCETGVVGGLGLGGGGRCLSRWVGWLRRGGVGVGLRLTRFGGHSMTWDCSQKECSENAERRERRIRRSSERRWFAWSGRVARPVS